MSKIWLVAQREYLYNLTRRSYLFTVFGTPLFIVGIWLLIFTLLGGEDDFSGFDRVGYVDDAGVVVDATLQRSAPASQDDNTPAYVFVAYESAAAAQSALDAGDIDAYFVLPADYLTTGAVQRYAYGNVPSSLNETFREILLYNLSREVEVGFPAERLMTPFAQTTALLLDSGRELNQDAAAALLLTPLFFAILFSLALQTTGSFLMNGLVQEKTNRILEILVTSITPVQMLTGKVIGLGLLGLSQIAVWVGVAVVFFLVGPSFQALAFLEGFGIPWDLFIIGGLYFVVGYFFFGSILATIGVLAGSEQQSNQYAAIVNLSGYLIPIFTLTSFIENSNGTLPVVLSMIPLTAPLAMMFRVGFGAVPLPELALSLGILLVSTLFVTWASGKLFRWGLLMYGKKFTPRDLISVVMGQREMGVTSEVLKSEITQERAV